MFNQWKSLTDKQRIILQLQLQADSSTMKLSHSYYLNE